MNSAGSDAAPESSEMPQYDKVHRELWFRDEIVKRFRQLAQNQELILLAFEEQGWPNRIDDPLPGGSFDPKQRLHDTIKDLNRRQLSEQLHFLGDGTGCAVCWRAA